MLVVGVVEKSRIGGPDGRRDVAAERDTAVGKNDGVGGERLGARGGAPPQRGGAGGRPPPPPRRPRFHAWGQIIAPGSRAVVASMGWPRRQAPSGERVEDLLVVRLIPRIVEHLAMADDAVLVEHEDGAFGDTFEADHVLVEHAV